MDEKRQHIYGVDLSTPASGNHSKIEAQPVVDKSAKQINNQQQNPLFLN